MSECSVLGCTEDATHLTGGKIPSEVCEEHAGPNATPMEDDL